MLVGFAAIVYCGSSPNNSILNLQIGGRKSKLWAVFKRWVVGRSFWTPLFHGPLQRISEPHSSFFIWSPLFFGRPRQGLTRLPRKGAEAWPARCGGDFRSPRKPAGPDFRQPRSSKESPAAAPQKLLVETVFLNFRKVNLKKSISKKIIFLCLAWLPDYEFPVKK